MKWELRSKVGEGHEEVIAVRVQLAAINKAMNLEANRILGNMQIAYDTALDHEHALEASLQKLVSARGNSEDYLKLQQLRRVADADRKLYESYLSQFNEISMRRTLQDASARIITPAGLAQGPNSRRRALVYGVAGIFGLGTGLGLALLLELFRAGIKTGAEAERSFGYPVVGVIPFAQPGKSGRGARTRGWCTPWPTRRSRNSARLCARRGSASSFKRRPSAESHSDHLISSR